MYICHSTEKSTFLVCFVRVFFRHVESWIRDYIHGINFATETICKRLQWLTGPQTCHNINQIMKSIATSEAIFQLIALLSETVRV